MCSSDLEVLLRSRFYNAPVDVFAVGCIMAELYMLRPLFPGNSESDMIQKVCQVLGTPDKQVWPDGYKLAQTRRVKFPEYPRTALEKMMPHASGEAIEVMDGLMMWNPDHRLTAQQCLAHKYFVHERERFEAKERERAREKERERRERRERDRGAVEGALQHEARARARAGARRVRRVAPAARHVGPLTGEGRPPRAPRRRGTRRRRSARQPPRRSPW